MYIKRPCLLTVVRWNAYVRASFDNINNHTSLGISNQLEMIDKLNPDEKLWIVSGTGTPLAIIEDGDVFSAVRCFLADGGLLKELTKEELTVYLEACLSLEQYRPLTQYGTQHNSPRKCYMLDLYHLIAKQAVAVFKILASLCSRQTQLK
jgi:hypothetical protein